MSQITKSVVIVGGGTAGWITAGTIAARLASESDQRPSVTLVESARVPPIGVGEGTWPTMRRTLRNMGVSETDFLQHCNATFKQGAKFACWATGKADDYYYHPLMLPQGYHEANLAPHWAADARSMSFSDAVCPQESLCERGLAPKQISTAEYEGVANYAYHLDAGALSEFLKQHCIAKLGVRHVTGDVTKVRQSDDGDIAAVCLANGDEVAGDLFVDCTGFKSLLLGETLGIPFKPCHDILFADRALAVQVPNASEAQSIASHTISVAQANGWIWDIGLPNRRGVGHVYSSAHSSDDQAEAQLRAYLASAGTDPDALAVRKISFEAGHRERLWERNCVAVGLSAGFLEPLESSALLLIEISAGMIADQFPITRSAMDVVARRFNATFLYHWARIIDFLKLHYVLSNRTDSEFWCDNRRADSVPDSLSELLLLWRYQAPWHDDFDRAVEVFPAASYQYVLYGMGFRTENNPLGWSEARRKSATRLFERNREETQKMVNSLPSNRELLDKIRKYGLQKV